MSIFDPQLLLDDTTEQVSERRDPVPMGDYQAIIAELAVRQGEKDGKPWVAMDIILELVIPPEAAEKLGYSTFRLRDNTFLDLTESGTIDYGKGKNNRLRAYRDATDLNKPGERFSPRMLQGRMVRVAVQHELYNGNTQERAKGIARW